ncbi:SusC/RagA family TonB-linked outer membrane protein [Flavobacteriaceae bacterium]|nr:SusC/RagA family TonB-linked outer membrane protein [Flavobacteriaceae bacterium]MDC0870726.1 SusC/RagA family TonB-linked outer membrane protein [Flavobacteriaceae bacterium]
MKNCLLKKPLLIIMLLIGSITYGQSIKGVVSDADGSLPGVSITVKGTTTGVQTDFDGNYTIKAKEGDVLVYNYLGYKTEQRTVGSESVINVTMTQDSTELDEIVVIGYGSTTVKDATGSVTSVTSGDFNKGVISSPEQLIQGKTAGVQISNTSGAPGAGVNIRIRGSNSVRSNNNPLFVVDGVPLSGGATTAGANVIGLGGNPAKNPLNFLNPNDIESISILKDASATAIYGSRGANGVVIVTTKSGRSKKGEFSYQANISSSKALDTYDLLSADKFLSERLRVGLAVDAASDYGSATDWQDVIFRTAMSHNQNLSYSKSHDNGSYIATLGLGNQTGIVENSNLERLTARVNLNHRFLDDKLRLSFQGSVSRVNDNLAPTGGTAGYKGDILGAAFSANPTWPNDPDFDGGTLVNPANLLAYTQGTTNTNRYLANLSLEYDLTSNLKAKLAVGIDKSDSDNFSVSSADVLGLEDGIPGNGRGAYNMLEVQNELLEATLTYNKEYKNSKLEVLGGFSYQSFRNSGLYSGAWGFSSRDLDVMGSNLQDIVTGIAGEISGQYQQFGYAPNLTGVYVRGYDGLDFVSSSFSANTSTANVNSLAVDTYDNTTELQSFFGRVNYTLSNKYLFTATLRADGSSAFAEANRYGYFPSGAFAWKLNEEDFMSDSNMSTLKLRLSAGITGNQEGVGYGNYVNRSRWNGLNPQNNGNIDLNNGNSIISFGGDGLKWESTIQYATGLDFGFNNDRLSGSIDVYRKETKDLLFLVDEAQPAILDRKFKNLTDSKIVNQGVEFSLGYDLVQTEDFNWSANFNVAYNDNMVESLSGQYDFANVNGPGLSGAFAMRLQEGYPLFSYYMQEFSGYDSAGQPIVGEKGFVGKSALPNLTGGLSTTINYKKWTMSAYFSGQFGHYVYNNTANAFFTAGAFKTTRNVLPGTLTSGEDLGASAPVSTRFLEKGDFVRLQNLSLAYDMPLSGEGVFKSMVFSVTGQNLFLMTDYSGLDPEVNSATGGNLPSIGMDYGAYPNPTTITFGINAKF